MEWGSADSPYLVSAQNPNVDRRAEPDATDAMNCAHPETGTTSRAGARTSRVTRAGGDDHALLRVGLVVLLDVVEVVEIVHHQAVGLRDAVLATCRRAN